MVQAARRDSWACIGSPIAKHRQSCKASQPVGTMADGPACLLQTWPVAVQDKVKAQIEAEPKAEAKASKGKGLIEDTEAGEDPVDAALAKYGIICENPWEKGVK